MTSRPWNLPDEPCIVPPMIMPKVFVSITINLDSLCFMLVLADLPAHNKIHFPLDNLPHLDPAVADVKVHCFSDQGNSKINLKINSEKDIKHVQLLIVLHTFFLQTSNWFIRKNFVGTCKEIHIVPCAFRTTIACLDAPFLEEEN